MSNSVYQQLKKELGSKLDVTPQEVEAYTRFKYMKQVYCNIITHVANKIWEERYAKSICLR